MDDKTAVDPEDKSYLYKMREVKCRNRGLPKGAKEKWKSYVNDLHREIQLACRDELTDASTVVPNKDYKEMIDTIIGRVDNRPLERMAVSESKDTIIGVPTKHISEKKQSNVSGRSVFSYIRESNYSEGSEITFVGENDGSEIAEDESRTQQQEEGGDDDDMYVNPPTPPPEKAFVQRNENSTTSK